MVTDTDLGFADFVLPFISVVAMIEGCLSATAEAMMTTNEFPATCDLKSGLIRRQNTLNSLTHCSGFADFALPFISVVAMIEGRPSATAEAMLTTRASPLLEKSPSPSPDKPFRNSKEFFILPADSTFGVKSLTLASHPIPANIMDSSSDVDSPIHSPMSNPEMSHFSPFK